jgi:protein TonB
MTSLARSYAEDARLHQQGWVCSVVFHAIIGAGILTLVSGLTPSREPDSFKWNVALVEAPKPPQPVDAAPEIRPEPFKPRPPQPKAMEPQPVRPEPVIEPVQQRVVQPTPVVQRQVTQTVHATNHIATINQAASTVIAQAVQRNEVVSQVVAPVTSQGRIVHEEQSTSTQPVLDQATVASFVTESIVSRQAVEPVPQPPVIETAGESATHPQQPAVEHTVPQAGPPKAIAAAKPDYEWLMKALLGRINELKNYPHLARINHWEGKVVLRAVIKDDGQVLMVDVQESSGRSVLDNDAMETLRKASPLKLEHPLGKPQVAILMPISYSLR